MEAKVSKTEFDKRRKAYKPVPSPIKHGAVGKFAALATSADTGGVLTWPGREQSPKKM